jgi:hypothetical protein
MANTGAPWPDTEGAELWRAMMAENNVKSELPHD